MKKNCEIVLVNTQLPENLGSVARGMLNFNFERLRIVNPKFAMNHEKIVPLSAGAEKVLKKSKVFNSFAESINDLNYVVGMTNRFRAIKKKQINLEKIIDLIANKNNLVGLVFGPEKSGLDNDHISLCDYVFKIDTNPKFSSLNLSHAVTIVCNKIFEILQKTKKTVNLRHKKMAKKNDLILFYKILEKSLDESNFFKVEERKKVIFRKIKNIFSKAELTLVEIRTLISIIKSLKK